FVLDDRRLRRSAMDYYDLLDWRRWPSWSAYEADQHDGRLVLLTTAAQTSYLAYRFGPNDRIMLGRESAGVPQHVHAAADERLRIPLRPSARSLNVAMAAAMVSGEALRQIGAGPPA
ncbi:MAG: TrmH family RNA methyltransferase, partial [Pseudomonadota bacterium]